MDLLKNKRDTIEDNLFLLKNTKYTQLLPILFIMEKRARLHACNTLTQVDIL